MSWLSIDLATLVPRLARYFSAIPRERRIPWGLKPAVCRQLESVEILIAVRRAFSVVRQRVGTAGSPVTWDRSGRGQWLLADDVLGSFAVVKGRVSAGCPFRGLLPGCCLPAGRVHVERPERSEANDVEARLADGDNRAAREGAVTWLGGRG